MPAENYWERLEWIIARAQCLQRLPVDPLIFSMDEWDDKLRNRMLTIAEEALTTMLTLNPNSVKVWCEDKESMPKGVGEYVHHEEWNRMIRE